MFTRERVEQLIDTDGYFRVTLCCQPVIKRLIMPLAEVMIYNEPYIYIRSFDMHNEHCIFIAKPKVPTRCGLKRVHFHLFLYSEIHKIISLTPKNINERAELNVIAEWANTNGKPMSAEDFNALKQDEINKINGEALE